MIVRWSNNPQGEVAPPTRQQGAPLHLQGLCNAMFMGVTWRLLEYVLNLANVPAYDPENTH